MEQHSTLAQHESPFVIPHEDIQVLEESQAFTVLRSYLARDVEYVLPPVIASRYQEVHFLSMSHGDIFSALPAYRANRQH